MNLDVLVGMIEYILHEHSLDRVRELTSTWGNVSFILVKVRSISSSTVIVESTVGFIRNKPAVVLLYYHSIVYMLLA